MKNIRLWVLIVGLCGSLLAVFCATALCADERADWNKNEVISDAGGTVKTPLTPAAARVKPTSPAASVIGMTQLLSAGDLKETTVRVESMKRLAEALKRISEKKRNEKTQTP